VNNKMLMDSIDRAVLLVKEGSKKPIVISTGENSIRLSINSDLGKMDEDIEAEKTGKDIVIGFNPKFVMDALKVIDDEKVGLYMLNSKSPCFIKDEDESYIYVVLPVNIKND
ncbi:MAG: DNA polymerase III subunit beta, partial [Lachnospiraceae bacterium]|nr:DNA polymerase III subunit beta [Lachnospiraceae bacterium]